ncbi:hypothetical protein SELMODRAFT_409889 [Selaginella moellendorffii]|uniref:Uncharacterized protein n=1 Tax=Selaginella moellendorffii TaxID=88036 RepID=D8RCS9_SELML|nr:hypothetical protein SELMODRAFT_409889 [Selaginella moellendorffii]
MGGARHWRSAERSRNVHIASSSGALAQDAFVPEMEKKARNSLAVAHCDFCLEWKSTIEFLELSIDWCTSTHRKHMDYNSPPVPKLAGAFESNETYRYGTHADKPLTGHSWKRETWTHE